MQVATAGMREIRLDLPQRLLLAAIRLRKQLLRHTHAVALAKHLSFSIALAEPEFPAAILLVLHRERETVRARLGLWRERRLL